MRPAQIKALRKRLGFTQGQLAAVLFVNRQTVSRWESGAFRVEDHTLPSALLETLRTANPPAAELRAVRRQLAFDTVEKRLDALEMLIALARTT